MANRVQLTFEPQIETGTSGKRFCRTGLLPSNRSQDAIPMEICRGNSMKLNIAICCYQPDADASRMLSSLASCSGLEAIDTVWLVENGTTSTEYTPPREAGESLPLRHVVLPERGVARARQWVVDTVQGGFMVFLDSDVTIHPALVEAYSRAMAQSKRGVIYGGPLDVRYESPPPDWLIPYLPRSARGWDPVDPNSELSHDPWFCGANFGAYCEDILACGGFNVDLGPGSAPTPGAAYPTGHEVDLQSRMIANGATLEYLANARVVHAVPRDRCTPEWSLGRSYQAGIERGLASRAKHRRLPKYFIREFMEAFAARAWSSVIRDPERNYVMRKRWAAITGFFEGRRRSNDRKSVKMQQPSD